MANAGTGNAVPATGTPTVFSQNAGAAPVNGDMPGFTQEQLNAGSAFWASAPNAQAISDAAARNNLTPEQVASSWAQSGYGSYDQGLQNIKQYTAAPSSAPTTPAPTTPAPPAPTAPVTQNPNIFDTAATGINNAITTATGETSYKPIMVSAGTGTASQAGNVAPIVAGQIANTDLTAYTNPYETQVVNQTLSDLDRSRQMQAMQLNAQATRGGAFGGSRQALMQSELGRNYLDQASRAASALRQGGYQNAQQLAGQDIATRMQAGTTNAQLGQQVNLANQAALNNMSQFNLNNQLQAALANQGMDLSGSQQRLAAAGQTGSLANLGFGMGMDIQNQAMTQGALERGINQALLNAAKGQYQGAVGAPGQSLDFINKAIGLAPVPITQTQSREPGLFDYLTLASTAASGTNFASDIRLKDAVTKIGELSDKIGLYRWKWNDAAKALGIDTEEVGVLAQEVEAVMPEAVSTAPNGYKQVRYDMVFNAFA